MKLGGFGRISDYHKIGKAGFDFAELDMPEIEELSAAQFEVLLKEVKATGFEILTGARLFPLTEPTFFVDGFAPSTFVPYLEKVCQRTAALGIRKIILGNGKARFLQTTADIQKEPVFIELVRIIADIAAANGQELILEPLGPMYSNYINTIPEAVAIIKKAGRSNVFTMADLRHMVGNEEPLSNIVDYVSYIHHIHVDYPISYPERDYPEPEDGYDYGAFWEVLKLSGYNDTVTIEADVPKDWNLAYQKAMKAFGK